MIWLTDGVILLRPLMSQDAAAHLAGEDDEIANWLSGGRSTPDTVRQYIARSLEDWQKNGPRRAFGIFDCATGSLVGSVEANLSLPHLDSGQANVSYGVFAAWRGKGIALRALRLICEYLTTSTDVCQVVLRTAPGNKASIRVAEKAGFKFIGANEETDGSLSRYVLDLR
jgi:RimJ/RimL family protein N-acetyltransferase